MNPDALLTELGELATALGPAVRPAGTDELLRSLTETARRLFGAAACSLALLSEDESELIYTVAAGEGADDVTGMRISSSQGPGGPGGLGAQGGPGRCAEYRGLRRKAAGPGGLRPGWRDAFAPEALRPVP